MSEIIDITGEIYNGMWNYEPPFPNINIRPLTSIDWVSTKIYCDIFDGLHSQTGTYLETPAHLLGDSSYPLRDVPLEKLIAQRTVILKLKSFEMGERREAVTAGMLENCPASGFLQENDAILVCCDWGRYWRYPGYLLKSPYFTYDAMKWLISKKPFLLGSDFPRWENMENPQGFFPEFYANNILMLAPCVSLEKAASQMKLTVLPLNIENTCCAPCRAFLQL